MFGAVLLVVLGASSGPWGDLQLAGAGSYGTGWERTSASGLGSGRVDLEVFLSRVVGLGAGVEFAQAAIYYDSRSVYRQWQPSASLSWWISSSGGLGLEYRFIHSEAVEGRATPFDTHRVALALGFRLG